MGAERSTRDTARTAATLLLSLGGRVHEHGLGLLGLLRLGLLLGLLVAALRVVALQAPLSITMIIQRTTAFIFSSLLILGFAFFCLASFFNWLFVSSLGAPSAGAGAASTGFGVSVDCTSGVVLSRSFHSSTLYVSISIGNKSVQRLSGERIAKVGKEQKTAHFRPLSKRLPKRECFSPEEKAQKSCVLKQTGFTKCGRDSFCRSRASIPKSSDPVWRGAWSMSPLPALPALASFRSPFSTRDRLVVFIRRCGTCEAHCCHTP